MTTILLKVGPTRPDHIRPLRDWLRQARAALKVPRHGIEGLPESYLRDIGVRSTDLARDRLQEPTRLGLLDLGWQPPHPPVRRR